MARKKKKGFNHWLRKAGLLLVVMLVGWLVNLYWYKPFSISMFFERAFYEYSLDHPETLTEHHAFERYAFNNAEQRLNDISLENWRETCQRVKWNIEMLRSYRTKELSEEDRLSQQILDFYWEMNILLRYDDEDIYLNCQYPIDQVDGVHISFIDFMLNTHEINKLDDAVDYLERLKKGKAKLRQASDNLPPVHRAPPSFILEKVMEQIHHFVTPPLNENLLCIDFREKVERASNMPMEAKDELYEDLERIIEFDLIPAYQRLYDDLKILYRRQLDKEQSQEEIEEMPYSPGLLPVSLKKVGPDGDDYQKPVGYIYYSGILKYHMGVHYNQEVNVDSILYVVDGEVYDLQNDLSMLLDSAGFPVEDELLLPSLAALSKQDTFLYSNNTVYEKQEMYSDITRLVLEANHEAKDIFGYQAQQLEIRPMVTHRVPYTSRFFYYPASLDEYRKARLFINFDSLQRMPKFQLPVLIRSYTSPGLHFLKTVQHSNDHLPTFRRAIIDVEAYTKGWTFYAQRILWEKGVYQSLHEKIGYLHWELIQAVTALADNQIHMQGQARGDVVSYVSQNSGIPRWEAEAIVDKIVVEPGKAIAYWTGYHQILLLKEQAVDSLGGQFSLKEFHQVLLDCGPAPMHILKQEVERYIEANTPENAVEASGKVDASF